MKFVVVKWWPLVPESIQVATQETFTDKVKAQKVADALQADNPQRRFSVSELKQV